MDLISLRNAEARKLGLSYGKYMAMVRAGMLEEKYPDPKKKAQAEEKTEERLCEICGGPMPEGARSATKTCGPVCSYELNRRRNQKAYMAKRQLQAMHERACLRCEKIFLPSRVDQKFCSAECGKAYRTIVQRRIRNGETISDLRVRSYGIGVCSVCGDKFQKHSANHAVCSRECRAELEDMRRRRGLC